MNVIERFKHHLISNKNKPSKITIKNYLSDINKFINWLEDQSSASFNPKKISTETISVYQGYLNKKETPSSSVKRYLSSLRKFFHFLKQENLINNNPFDQDIDIKQLSENPFMLDQFKVYLLSEKISKLTIKNYLADIKHFLVWIEKILGPLQEQNAIKHINELIIDEYKNRLRTEAHLSPVSINRKLSSLRKYLGWSGTKKININNVSLLNTQKTTNLSIDKKFQLFKKIRIVNKQNLHEISNTSNHIYSGRVKKIINIINYFNDLIITLPIIKILEKSEVFIWKIKGSNAFVPTQKILNNYLNPHDYKKPYKHSTALNILSVSKNINKNHIHNIPKSIYAPLQISAKSLPRHKKIYFHIVHNRPKWYKIYHSYPVVHYLHAAILLIFTTVIGSVFYNNFYVSPQQKTVFANPRLSPPKIISFQGKLSDAHNNPIIEATPLRFAIYNNPASSGSALLWQEVQIVHPDTNGAFNTQIGQENPISSPIFSDNPALYLGMTVANESELQPRQELATTSYSNNSQQLQGLIPITQNGAGTRNVILALDSAGNLTIGGKASPTFEASSGQFTISGKTLLLASVTGSDGNIKIMPDGNGIIDLQKPLQNTTNNNNINSAQGAVEIDDLLAILATSSGQSALTINQDSTGPLISASTSGIAMFTLENNGTGIFAGNLVLNGNNLISTNTSFDLLNTDTINLNIGNAATAISMGAGIGNTTINNTLITSSLIVSGYITSDISPSSTGAYNLGSSTNHWNNAYIDNLFTSQAATASGFWQRNKETVSLFNSADSLLIAGTTPENAKFQILGSGAKAGTASTSGQLTFINNSQVNLLNNAHLGFYNSTASDSNINSANPALYLTSNGNIGIGTNNPAAKLQVNGNIKAYDIDIDGADLAENYISSQSLEAGDLIMPEGKDNNTAVIKTTMPYESKTIGIVSTKPGIILNSDALIDNAHPYVVPIALSGRVPVKVTTQNGSIKTGDYLTTSSIPGISMKATKKGFVIGKALEDYTNPDPNTIGKIMVFVNLSFFDFTNTTGYYETYNPQDNIENIHSYIQTVTQAIFDNIKVGFIQAQQTITDSLIITTDNITIGSQTLKEYISDIVRNSLQQEIEKELSKYQIPNTKYQPSDPLSPLASESAMTRTIPETSSATDSTQQSDNLIIKQFNNDLATSSAAIASNSATYITNVTNIYNTPTSSPSADLYPASNSALINNPAVSNSTKSSTNLYSASDSAIQQFAASQKLVPLGDNNVTIEQLYNPTMPQLNNDYIDLSSSSGIPSYIPKLYEHLPTLQVLGITTLSDVAITGELNVNGSLILANNAINTLGNNLELQPLRQGNLSIMGNLITIDTDGNLKVSGNAVFAKDVNIKGKLSLNIIAPIPNSDLIIQLDNKITPDSKSTIHNSEFIIRNATGSSILTVNQLGDIHASGSGTFLDLSAKSFKIIRGAQADTSLVQTSASSSAGTAIIKAYEAERTIISPFATKDSLIYLTAASDTQGLIPYIARQTEKDFTIAIPYAINKDIKVNWWIIN